MTEIKRTSFSETKFDDLAAAFREDDKALQKAFEMSEFEKFDATVRKVLSVSHDELKKRERAWKRNRTKRKQRAEAKASRERRASVDKD